MLSLRKLTPVQLVMTSQLADAFAAGHVFVLRTSSPRPSSTGAWTSDHNLNAEVASALDLHRRGASLLCCPPIAELGWTRLSEGPRSVGGWEPAQVVKAASRTFLPRAVAAAATKQALSEPAISASCVCTEKLSCTGCLFMA